MADDGDQHSSQDESEYESNDQSTSTAVINVVHENPDSDEKCTEKGNRRSKGKKDKPRSDEKVEKVVEEKIPPTVTERKKKEGKRSPPPPQPECSKEGEKESVPYQKDRKKYPKRRKTGSASEDDVEKLRNSPSGEKEDGINKSPSPRERSRSRSKSRESDKESSVKKNKSSRKTVEEEKKTKDKSPKKRKRTLEVETIEDHHKKLKRNKSLPLLDNTKDKGKEQRKEDTKSEEEESSDSGSEEEESESSSSSSEESSDSEDEKKKKKKSKKKITSRNKKRKKLLKKLNKSFFSFNDKKEKYKFKLSKNLAEWANDHIEKFTTDKIIEDEILLKNQVPLNIKEIHKVDSFIEEFLKERGRKDHTWDASISRLHRKVRTIFGPLSKVWEAVYACNEGVIKEEEINFEVVEENIQQTVILVGQAMNALNFHRRRSILRGLIGDDTKATTWLRSTYEEELKENKKDLFGEEIRTKWSSDAKAKNMSLKQFLAPPQDKRKPFRKPSFKHQSSNREEGRRHNEERRESRDSYEYDRSEKDSNIRSNRGQTKRGGFSNRGKTGQQQSKKFKKR